MLILPRSLVDEAKNKIWSINQIQFSFFAPAGISPRGRNPEEALLTMTRAYVKESTYS